MQRWERVGVFKESPERFQGHIEVVQEDWRSIGDYSNPTHDQDACRTGDLTTCMNAVLLQHFEVVHPLGDVRAYAEKVVTIALDYFFGPWRDAYSFYPKKPWNRNQCRKRLEWVAPYLEGLLCAMLLDDWEAVLRLADWPGPDVNRKDLDYTPADIDYYILQARHLKGSPTSESKRLVASIQTGPKQRAKKLLKALQAIEAGDAPRFEAALNVYLKHFWSYEAELDELERSVSMDGSILWHVARRAGLPLPALPVQWMDLIVTQQTIAGSGELETDSTQP